MGKIIDPSEAQLERERNEHIAGFVKLLRASKEEASRLFAGDERSQTIFGVVDRLVHDADGELELDETAADLRESLDIAKKVFGDRPSAEAVFGVFDRLFVGDDVDEDDDN